ncbi:MAG: C-terminal binding protein [Atopobiaceae bacterium]|nr:C-terminal binding protein [Atopobiaceae bacterium]
MDKVVILNAFYPEYSIEHSILDPLGVDVVVEEPGVDNRQGIMDAVRDATVVITRETVIDAEVIDAMEQCKLIVRYGIGVDNFDLETAKARGIYVANTPTYGCDAVAEQAVALMFGAMRHVATRDADVRAGKWDIGDAEVMYGFGGKTLGVVGLGRIARAFMKKVSGLGWGRVLGYDPYVEELEGVELVNLDALFAEADVISLHSPLTPETHHMVDAARLATMKRNAILVNTSRGGLVDTVALADALQAGQILGAGIDVFEEEPPAADNPLFACRTAVLSDHTGWYSVESLENLHRMAAEEAARVLKGEEPLSWVNRW